MISEKKSIAVVYLAWLPLGIKHFKFFIDSYNKYSAGYPHKLIIAFNGVEVEHVNSSEEYIKYLNENKIEVGDLLYYNKGQDLEIYNKVASETRFDFFLFLNSYSKINSRNWLKIFKDNQRENVGLIGASGSYSDYVRAMNMVIKRELLSTFSISKKLNIIKYGVKINFFKKNGFKAFPNPHIRTNAFFISKNIFCNLKFPFFKSKLEAYYFENGINSLTNQVMKLGLECIVIDKFGNSYTMEKWPEQNIFWQGNQSGLLISDNQTEKYDNGSVTLKRELQKQAWNL